jgi:hypothetical protein
VRKVQNPRLKAVTAGRDSEYESLGALVPVEGGRVLQFHRVYDASHLHPLAVLFSREEILQGESVGNWQCGPAHDPDLGVVDLGCKVPRAGHALHLHHVSRIRLGSSVNDIEEDPRARVLNESELKVRGIIGDDPA